MKVFLNTLGIVNALGADAASVSANLFAGSTSGMVREPGWLLEGDALVGRVSAPLPMVPPELSRYVSRNNQLLMAAFEQIRSMYDQMRTRYGQDRIGIILGTSTSGVAEAEAAIAALSKEEPKPAGYDYAQQEMGSPSAFLAEWLELPGIAYTISTACTSSAKAIISAYRLVQSGLCDVVIVGGVDSLCRLTLNGFQVLESMSSEHCLPMSRNRRGINIGEGAALFLMSREPIGAELAGFGESSDAYHMSAPDPEGRGAETAMRQALSTAGIAPRGVGYVNLHGTATSKNDEMESRAMERVFGLVDVPSSSTKPCVGHTLGAAGATELAFGWLMLTQAHSLLPPHVWDGEQDPALAPIRLARHGEYIDLSKRVVMSNSYAFGGSNVSLVLRAG